MALPPPPPGHVKTFFHNDITQHTPAMASTPNIRQKFELRVLLFDGKRYAIYQSTSVNRHDIYTSMGHLDGRNLFRQSYHLRNREKCQIGFRAM
jgi:hypothetical protein